MSTSSHELTQIPEGSVFVFTHEGGPRNWQELRSDDESLSSEVMTDLSNRVHGEVSR